MENITVSQKEENDFQEGFDAGYKAGYDLAESYLIQDYKPLMLIREGDYIYLKMELKPRFWITLIKELADSPISHIIEHNGIQSAITNFTASSTEEKMKAVI